MITHVRSTTGVIAPIQQIASDCRARGVFSIIDVGWFSHEEPFEFDPHDFRFAADARRFWGGTPTVAPFVFAAAIIRYLSRIGVETIRAHGGRGPRCGCVARR